MSHFHLSDYLLFKKSFSCKFSLNWIQRLKIFHLFVYYQWDERAIRTTPKFIMFNYQTTQIYAGSELFNLKLPFAGVFQFSFKALRHKSKTKFSSTHTHAGGFAWNFNLSNVWERCELDGEASIVNPKELIVVVPWNSLQMIPFGIQAQQKTTSHVYAIFLLFCVLIKRTKRFAAFFILFLWWKSFVICFLSQRSFLSFCLLIQAGFNSATGEALYIQAHTFCSSV